MISLDFNLSLLLGLSSGATFPFSKRRILQSTDESDSILLGDSNGDGDVDGFWDGDGHLMYSDDEDDGDYEGESEGVEGRRGTGVHSEKEGKDEKEKERSHGSGGEEGSEWLAEISDNKDEEVRIGSGTRTGDTVEGFPGGHGQNVSTLTDVEASANTTSTSILTIRNSVS